jgi:hypothetical protein
MPAVPTRQKPPPAANGPPIKAAPGSVLSKAIPASAIKDTWIKMLMYGPSGTGKTHLAGTFEKPLLHISLDKTPSGGARTVRKFPGVTCIRPGALSFEEPIVAAECVAEMMRLADELKAHNPFKTVVFDHVTVFQDYVLEKVTGKMLPEQIGFGVVSGDEYRDRSEIVKTALRPWVDLQCHTVFVGKEKDHNPPRNETKNPKTGKVQPDMRPRFIRGLQQESCVTVNLGGGAADWLMDACEFICRLYMDKEMEWTETEFQGVKTRSAVETGKYVRALRIGYHPNFAARFRSDSPETLPEAIPEPSFAKIVAAIEGRYKP